MYEEIFRFALVRDPDTTKDKPAIELELPRADEDDDGNVNWKEALEVFLESDDFISSTEDIDEDTLTAIYRFQKSVNNENPDLNTATTELSDYISDSLKSDLNDSLLCHKFIYFENKQTLNVLAKLYRLLCIKDGIVSGSVDIDNIISYKNAAIIYPENFERQLEEPTQREIESQEIINEARIEASQVEIKVSMLAKINDTLKSQGNERIDLNGLNKKLDSSSFSYLANITRSGLDILAVQNTLQEEINTTIHGFIDNLSNAGISIPSTQGIQPIQGYPVVRIPEIRDPLSAIRNIAEQLKNPINVTTTGDSYFRDKPLRGSKIRKSGVMDLLIIKQRIKGYKAGEVAHIENVMKGEKRERKHVRKHYTEDYFETESETEETEERDLQSTERSELTRESSKVVKEETELEAGLTVTGSYGTVKIQASGSASLRSSKDQAVKSAETYARQVVEKALSRIIEKTRKLQSTKIINEIEEVNLHSFENRNHDQSEHISGVYQFYDKIYQAKIYKYGQRTLYNILVPEPSALYLESFPMRNVVGQPSCPSSEITNVDVNSLIDDKTLLDDLVKTYGVKPPDKPNPTIQFPWVASDARGGGWSAHNHLAISQKVSIPKGYKLDSYKILLSSYAEIQKPRVAVHIGGFIKHFNVDTLEIKLKDTGNGNNDEENYKHLFTHEQKISENTSLTGEIPVAVSGDDFSVINVTVLFNCSLLDEQLPQWARETYQSFFSSYKDQLVRYEAELEEWKLNQLTQQIEGRNPSINRKIEHEELKRAATEVFMGTETDWNLIKKPKQKPLLDPCGGKSNNEINPSLTRPKINYKNRQRVEDVVFFIEQAFEWENMTYLFYPYYWGDQKEWKDKIRQDIDDYKFMQFIKAGAARVQIPVRPEFEARVDHFIDTGEVWKEKYNVKDGITNIETEEVITNRNMLPFHEEEAAALGRKVGEEAYVDENNKPAEWDVTVPTALIKLRKDDEMPRWWRDDDDGKWVYETGDLDN